MKIQKNDIVKIISGNDKGKSGRVIKVFPDKNRIIVEGINLVKKHSRPSQENPQGAILEKEMSIDEAMSLAITAINLKSDEKGVKHIRMTKIKLDTKLFEKVSSEEMLKHGKAPDTNQN